MEVLLTLKKKNGDSTAKQNGTTIQRNWSSSVQKYQCLESWDLETEERRFNKHRTLVPNNSFCKSAQYLRSSGELVSSVLFDRGRKGTSQFICGQQDLDKFTTGRSTTFGISSRQWHLETGCDKTFRASKHWSVEYSSHNYVKKVTSNIV